MQGLLSLLTNSFAPILRYQQRRKGNTSSRARSPSTDSSSSDCESDSGPEKSIHWSGSDVGGDKDSGDVGDDGAGVGGDSDSIQVLILPWLGMVHLSMQSIPAFVTGDICFTEHYPLD
jgi:hypothetical protein